MKTKLIIAVLAFGLSLSAHAGQGYVAYATGGQTYNSSSATNYAVIPNDALFGGTPIVNFLSAKSDALASGTGIVQFYKTTNEWTAATGYTNTGVSNFFLCNPGTGVGSTNGIAVGSLLVVKHNTPDPPTYELLFGASVIATAVATNIAISPNGNSTNFTYTVTSGVAASNAVVPGDNIYLCVTNGAGYVPVGVATTNYATSGGIYTGQRQKPLLLYTVGGTNAAITAVNATFTNP